ncbi:MAG: sigma-70 family RNA polymerase sigma factor [Planctomycetota bacterium]
MSRPPQPLSVETLLDNAEGMRRLARQLVRDAAEADDVAQDALVRALHAGPRDPRSPRAWLFGLVRNVARERRRTAVRRHAREQAAQRQRIVPSTAHTVSELAEHRRVLQCLAELPEPYRSALWSRHFRDLPPREIAAECGVPVETVRTWLKRGHQRLRERLDATDAQGGKAWRAALAPCLGAAAGRSVGWGGGLVMASATKAGALGVLTVLALLAGAWLLGVLDGERARVESPAGGVTADSASAGLAQPGSAPQLTAPGRASELVSDPGTLVGLVVDSHDAPVRGAHVLMGAADVASVDDMVVCAASGDDGRFTVTLDPAAERGVLAAIGPAGETTIVPVSASTVRMVVLRLPAGGADEVCVRSVSTGLPVPGARCEVRLREEGRTWIRTVVADEAGRASIPHMASRNVRGWRLLRVRALQHAIYEEVYSPGDTDPTRGTSDSPRDIWLDAAIELTVRVEDLTGQPVAGAVVQGWSGWREGPPRDRPEFAIEVGAAEPHDSRLELGRAVTDAAGRAILPGRKEYVNITVRADSDDGLGILTTLGGARNNEVRVVLRPTCRIRGRVVGPDGQPVVGAFVHVHPAEVAERLRAGGSTREPAPESLTGFHSRSGADGTFRLGPVSVPTRDGVPLMVQAVTGALGAAVASFDAKEAVGDIEADIVFAASDAPHRTLVVDAAGTPVEGALVFWGNMRPASVTDDSGLALSKPYALPDLELHVAKACYGVAHVPRDPSGTNRVVLHPECSLAGRLVDASGRGVRGHLVVYAAPAAEGAYVSAARLATAYAGDDGTFRCEHLPPPPWRIEFTHNQSFPHGGGRQLKGEALVDSTNDVVLALGDSAPGPGPRSLLEGVVLDPDGSPAGEYWIHLVQGERHVAPRTQSRRFRFERVPPGAYVAEAFGSGGRTLACVPLDVRPGEDQRDLVIRFSPEVDRAAHLSLPDGTPLAGATLRWERIDGHGGSEGRTDAEGAVRLTTVLPGRYRLSVQAPDADGGRAWLPGESTLLVEEGHNTPIALRMEPAARLVIVIDDDRLLPASRMGREPRSGESWEAYERTRWSSVVVRTESGHELRGGWAVRGRAVFPWALPAGVHRLEISLAGKLEVSTTFRTHGGEDTEVVVRFPEAGAAEAGSKR